MFNSPKSDLVLAICIGSHWPGPLNFPSSKEDLNTFVGEWRSKFKTAEDILLVGAGAVGLGMASDLPHPHPLTHCPPELAGELRDEYPVGSLSTYYKSSSLSSVLQTKKITMVHGHTLVLNQTYPVKFREMVGTQFKARNIEFILNDFVESFPESDSGEVGLKSGQKVKADLIVSFRAQM